MGEARREKLLHLFWALRGGGRGTFGVVVSVTYPTNDRLPFITFSLSVNLSTPAIAQILTMEYFAMLLELSNAGWGGFAFMPQGKLLARFFASNESLVQGNATFSLFLASAQAAVLNPQDFGVFPQSFPSFYDTYLAHQRIRLVSLEIAKDQPEKVSKVALGVSTGVTFIFVAGGAVSRANLDSAGLNPAWREALGLLVSDVTWNEGTQTAEIDRLRKQAASDLEVLDTFRRIQERISTRRLYTRNLERLQDNVHYAQLKLIKHRYDNESTMTYSLWQRVFKARRIGTNP
ncbi:hypothetical protein JOM56_009364 [Amanita muscaria]